jgi:hypothetical protein
VGKKSNRPATSGNGAAGGASGQAAYFLSLSLENVRCFREKQTLDLSDGKGGPARWTILLGNNGTGKTTVLQLLVVFTWLSRTAWQMQPPLAPGLTATDLLSGATGRAL